MTLKQADLEQQAWKTKTIEFAQRANPELEKALKHGSDAEDQDPENESPEDNGREAMVPSLLKALRAYNATGELGKLREQWPLAHAPLIPSLEGNETEIPTLAMLADGSIVARIGSHFEAGRVVHIREDKVEELPSLEFFGKCPNGRYFAYAEKTCIRISDGWMGDEVATFAYPNGTEDAPAGYALKAFEKPPIPTALIPFPDGKRLLFVSNAGIFVLAASGASRLLPTIEQMKEYFDWLQKTDPNDELVLELDMEHGAISQDGNYIAVGAQDSQHLVFSETLQQIATIDNPGPYSHYALFSSDNKQVAFNSCHFYDGVTIGVATSVLVGLDIELDEDSEHVTALEDRSRVYAGVSRAGEYIVGDADGYIRAFSTTGTQLWQHFIGSSIGAMDISKDGKTLVCSTFAGFVSIIELDSGNRQEYEIGTGPHHEVRRWVFWESEECPLAW